jgi:MFS family permease
VVGTRLLGLLVSRVQHQQRKTAKMFSALRYRNYRLFWLGQLISVTGTFMQATAQQWLVLTLTSNPLALGIVGALQWGPLIVPFGGAIGDRWPRRSVLVVTQACAGVLAVILFALTVTQEVQLWQVYLLALLLGIVNAVDMPTRQAFVSEMVDKENLLNAVSLNSVQFNCARIAGPALAGVLIGTLGVPPLFLLNATSYIAVIIGLLLMRAAELIPQPLMARAENLAARVRVLGDGARFVWGNSQLLITFLMLGVIGTLGFNFSVLLPLEAHDALHAGPQVFGLLSSALGIGALVGALWLARRGGAPTNRLLIATAAVFGVFEASVALSRSVPVTLALIALTGFAMASFSASANTRTQLSSPMEMRGRVMSVYTMLFIGTTPLGNLLVSEAASIGGVGLSFAISGVPCLLVAILAAWLWRRQEQRRSALPARQADPSLTVTADLVTTDL